MSVYNEDGEPVCVCYAGYRCGAHNDNYVVNCPGDAIPLREEVYDMARLAALLEVKEGTIRVWNSRGKLPPPDMYVSKRPAWWSSTLRDWLEGIAAFAQS